MSLQNVSKNGCLSARTKGNCLAIILLCRGDILNDGNALLQNRQKFRIQTIDFSPKCFQFSICYCHFSYLNKQTITSKLDHKAR